MTVNSRMYILSSLVPICLIEELKSQLEGEMILITGGTGFFGKSVLDFLLDIGLFEIDITILTRDPRAFINTYKDFNKFKRVKLIAGSIEVFRAEAVHYSSILHFAAPASAALNLSDPMLMANIIIEGTKNVLEYAAKHDVKKVLFASSGAVYGRQPEILSHVPEIYPGAPLVNLPNAAYGEAKRYAEMLGCAYARKYGFQFKIARCFAFVGPHLDRTGSFAIGNFIRDAINNKEIMISGDGSPMRSFLYADDLAAWLLKILFSGKNLEPYNVGSDQHLSISQLATTVRNVLSPGTGIVTKQKLNPLKPLERYVPDITKAKDELGLDVWTNLENAIRLSAK